MDFASVLRPEKTLLVGMSDDFEYYQSQRWMRKISGGLDIQLAHDGLEVSLSL